LLLIYQIILFKYI